MIAIPEKNIWEVILNFPKENTLQTQNDVLVDNMFASSGNGHLKMDTFLFTYGYRFAS